jgi:hypothetical protein
MEVAQEVLDRVFLSFAPRFAHRRHAMDLTLGKGYDINGGHVPSMISTRG